MDEEGVQFFWWRQPPEPRQFVESCKDKYFYFEKSVCRPRSEGDYLVTSKLTKLLIRRKPVRPQPKQDVFGDPVKEEEGETGMMYEEEHDDAEDMPSIIGGSQSLPASVPTSSLPTRSELEAIRDDAFYTEEEEEQLLDRRTERRSASSDAAEVEPIRAATSVTPSSSPPRQSQSLLGKRKANPVLEDSSSVLKHQEQFTTPLRLATVEEEPRAEATPRQAEEELQQRLQRDLNNVTEHGFPEGAIDMCGHDTVRFYQESAQLLQSNGKPIGCAMMLADGSTSFNSVKTLRKNKRSNKDEVDEEQVPSDDTAEQLIGIGFSFEDKIYFLPLQESPKSRVLLAHRWRFLAELLAADSVPKVGYNVQALLRMLYICHPPLREATPANLIDTRIGGWLLRPASNKQELFSYGALMRQYMEHYNEAGATGGSLFGLHLKSLVPLSNKIQGALRDNGLFDVFKRQEMPLSPILACMECAGISIDIDDLTKNRSHLEKRIALLEQRAEEWAGHKFLLSSPKQVAQVLFEELKLEVPSQTPTSNQKHPSTSEEVLLALREKHSLPDIILEHRHLQKLLRSFIDPFVNHATGQKAGASNRPRIHGKWDQATATGRLASRDPNLQNLPRPESLAFFLDGRDYVIPLNIRDSFVAQAGTVFLSADYSQLEMRLLAHLSKDASLVQFFHDGLDFFKLVASRIWSKASADVDDRERELAKRICYGITYGAGPQSLASEMKISLAKAKVFVERFFDRFPAVGRWINAAKRKAHEEGHVRTLFGRWRPLPDIHSSSKENRAAAERQAVNTIIQGTASDLVKRAMLTIAEHVKRSNMHSQLLLQIHDELIYEVPLEEEAQMAKLVRQCMEEASNLDIPLPVSVRVGERLGSLQPYTPEQVDQGLDKGAQPSPRIPLTALDEMGDAQPTSSTSLQPTTVRGPANHKAPSSAPPLRTAAHFMESESPSPRLNPQAPARLPPAARQAPSPSPLPSQSAIGTASQQMTYPSLSPNILSPAPSASPQLMTPMSETTEVKREEEDSLNENSYLSQLDMDPPDEEGDDLGIGVGNVQPEIEHPHDEIVSLGPSEVAEEDFSMPEEELANMENDLYDE